MSPELWIPAIATTVAIFALYYAGQSAHAARDSATAANEQASRTCCKRNLLELRLNRCSGPTPAVTRAGQRVRRCPHVLLLFLAAGEPKELSRQSDELEQSCLAARAGDAVGRSHQLTRARSRRRPAPAGAESSMATLCPWLHNAASAQFPVGAQRPSIKSRWARSHEIVRCGVSSKNRRVAAGPADGLGGEVGP